MKRTNYKAPNPWDEVLGDIPVIENPSAAKSYVYIIAAGGFVKIGWSKSPRARLSNIQTASPLPARLVATFAFDNSGAEEAEAFVHEKLRRFRRKGEWFAMSPERAEHEVAKMLCSLPQDQFHSQFLRERYSPKPTRRPITLSRVQVGGGVESNP